MAVTAPAERVSGDLEDSGAERPSVMGQMAQAFREGYSRIHGAGAGNACQGRGL